MANKTKKPTEQIEEVKVELVEETKSKDKTLFEDYVSRITKVNNKFVIYGRHFDSKEQATEYIKQQLKG